jgi:hypothetical protein
MPRVRPKGPSVDRDALYVATTTVATEMMPGLVRRGTKLRGSDPLVQAHREFFVPADTPQNEWPSPIPDPPAPVEPDHDLRVASLPIPLGDIVELVRPVKLLVGTGGEAWTGGGNPTQVVTVPAGTRFAASEAIVARLPGWFKAV